MNDGVGPEIIEVPGGSKVMTGPNSANYMRHMAGEQVTILNVYVQAGAVVASKAELGRVFIDAVTAAKRNGATLSFLAGR